MIVKVIVNDKGTPIGKLAEAELHFDAAPLAGMKLTGFAVWERATGQRNVTFPAKSYSINGEQRTFAHLRPIKDGAASDAIRDAVLAAYDAHVKGSLL
jgi:hypothetical protein